MNEKCEGAMFSDMRQLKINILWCSQYHGIYTKFIALSSKNKELFLLMLTYYYQILGKIFCGLMTQIVDVFQGQINRSLFMCVCGF